MKVLRTDVIIKASDVAIPSLTKFSYVSNTIVYDPRIKELSDGEYAVFIEYTKNVYHEYLALSDDFVAKNKNKRLCAVQLRREAEDSVSKVDTELFAKYTEIVAKIATVAKPHTKEEKKSKDNLRGAVKAELPKIKERASTALDTLESSFFF